MKPDSNKQQMTKQNNNLIKDVIIIVLSIVIAVFLAKSGVLKNLLTATQEIKLVGSFIAGLFFTSIFTVAPATVALGEIAQATSVFGVAFFGGLGALLGDWLIFYFIRDRLSENVLDLMGKSKIQKIKSIFGLKLFRWLIPLVGALIVASPLPDEIGLAMMGLSKMKTWLFIPMSFFLNFLGILIIGLVAKAII